jgi:hypothetical protein
MGGKRVLLPIAFEKAWQESGVIAFVLAGISRCAVAPLCPSDDELKAAIWDRTNAIIPEITRQSEADNPGQVVHIHPTVIKSIRDVHCGAPEPDKPATIACSFTVTYPSSVSYQIAVLSRNDGRWAIVAAHAVSRKR